MAFIKFMASTAGRLARIGLGILLFAIAIGVNGLEWLSILGVFFLAVGALDVCVFAPFVKLPFSGSKVRAATGSK